VCFELFVRPAVLALQGAREAGPTFMLGELARAVCRNPERDEFLRARVRVDTERVLLEPLGGQESHMIARAAAADALVLVPRGEVRRGCRPEHDQREQRERNPADRGELEQIPGRVEPETEPDGELPDQQHRTGEARKPGRQTCSEGSVAHLWKPEPGVK